MKAHFLSRCCALLSLLTIVGCPRLTERPIVEHILLISIDTLRPDHLGTYGHVLDTSPYLDRLAARGTVFTDAMSTASWTLPAHASVLTGLYPSQAGARFFQDPTSSDVPTLAGKLGECGFRTVGITNSIFLAQFGSGFDVWKGIKSDWSATGSGRKITDLAVDAMEKAGDESLFLFVHYHDVHSDYRSDPEIERLFLASGYDRSKNADLDTLMLSDVNLGKRKISERERDIVTRLYDAGIRQLDDQIGRLLEAAERHFSGAQLIVVLSDHGEEFGEHGGYLHGKKVYEELLRVPLIMAGDGVPSGVRVDAPVSLVDVTPTLLAAACPEQSLASPGFDLLDTGSHLDSKLHARTRLAQSAPAVRSDSLRAARRGHFKLIVDAKSGERELYDLSIDAGERTNVIDEHPEIARKLAAELELLGPTVSHQAPPRINTEQRERLRALGYIE